MNSPGGMSVSFIPIEIRCRHGQPEVLGPGILMFFCGLGVEGGNRGLQGAGLLTGDSAGQAAIGGAGGASAGGVAPLSVTR